MDAVAFWDRAAPRYAAAWDAFLAPVRTAVLEALRPEPGMELLEVASGPGLMAFPLAEAVGQGGRVEATDLSPRMVDRIRSGARARGLSRVGARVAAMEALPFAPGTFDGAVALLALHLSPDPRRALGELLRVVRPGGRIVLATWGTVGTSPHPHPGGPAPALHRNGHGLRRLHLHLRFPGPGAALEALLMTGAVGHPGSGCSGPMGRFPAAGGGRREGLLRALARWRWHRGYRIPVEVRVRTRTSVRMAIRRTGGA